jgi:hypothetical protein
MNAKLGGSVKSAKEIMAELGFDKSGSEETQKAFYRHLVREANRLNPDYKLSAAPKNSKYSNSQTQNQSMSQNQRLKETVEVQLSFDLEEKKQVS